MDIENIAKLAAKAYKQGNNPLPEIRRTVEMPVSFSCAAERAFFVKEAALEMTVFKLDTEIYADDEHIGTETEVYAAVFDNSEDIFRHKYRSESVFYVVP